MNKSSYSQIFNSSLIIGGSTVISIGIKMIRTKAMAVLLGPSGMALFGLYGSAVGVIGIVSGMGIGSSGVRHIAAADGPGDNLQLTKTVRSLRLVSLFTGALGALTMLVLCKYLSQTTFGDDEHSGALAIISLSLFFGAIAGGQAALLQGKRLIREMAIQKILSAVFSVLVGVPIVWFMGEKGIPWFLVSAAFFAMITSWWFAKQVDIEKINMGLQEFRGELKGLVGLGAVFMSTGLMAAVVIYFTRVLVVRSLGMDAAGYYQAAAGLSMLYVGIVLQAMGMDFYPRLTGVANDNAACNRMVNEQAEISLLLATPGVLVTLTFAPLVLGVFYSTEFLPAADVLRWQLLGVLGRVVTWPLGYIMLAKGAGRFFFWTELIFSLLHVAFVYLGVRLWGLEGTGVAFFMLYVTYFFVVMLVSRHLSGFSWTKENKDHWIRLTPAITLVFFVMWKLPGVIALIFSTVVTLVVSFWAFRRIHALLGRPPLSQIISRLKKPVSVQENN